MYFTVCALHCIYCIYSEIYTCTTICFILPVYYNLFHLACATGDEGPMCTTLCFILPVYYILFHLACAIGDEGPMLEIDFERGVTDNGNVPPPPPPPPPAAAAAAAATSASLTPLIIGLLRLQLSDSACMTNKNVGKEWLRCREGVGKVWGRCWEGKLRGVS